MEPLDQAPWGNRKPAGPARTVAILRTLTLFGFAQLDFAGTLALPDGRYVIRESGREEVLVIRTLSAPAPPRRRRRARVADVGAKPAALPLTRVTVVRASAPFAGEAEASSWLERVFGSDDSTEEALEDAVRVGNRALHTHAAASGDPTPQMLSTARAVIARFGYGSGEEVAEGSFTHAREVDPSSGGSRRRRRAEELRPQERVAAVLGGREQMDACETLVLRARADLDAGRDREAALQLRVGLDALLVELMGALDDPAHSEDMAALESRRSEAVKAADTALRGALNATQLASVHELVDLCERVLRRRRVLRG